MSSVSRIAIVPMQDLFDLGTEARMNRPSVASGNWDWRYRAGMLRQNISERLRELTINYGRSVG